MRLSAARPSRASAAASPARPVECTTSARSSRVSPRNTNSSIPSESATASRPNRTAFRGCPVAPEARAATRLHQTSVSHRPRASERALRRPGGRRGPGLPTRRPPLPDARPTSGASAALGRGRPGRTLSNLPSASRSNASPPSWAAAAVSWISSASASRSARRMRPTTAPTSTGREPSTSSLPVPTALPRLDVAVAEDLAKLDCGAGGADNIVLVRSIDAERRDELDAGFRRQRAPVTRRDVRDRLPHALEGSLRPPRARARRRAAAPRGAARRGGGRGGRRWRRLLWGERRVPREDHVMSARVSSDGSSPHCSSSARRVASYASSASCWRPARCSASMRRRQSRSRSGC